MAAKSDLPRFNVLRMNAVRWLLPSLAVLLSLNYLRLIWIRPGGPGPIVPYTVILKERIRSEPGTLVPSAAYTFAVRSDGSFVRLSELYSQQRSVSERSINLVGGDKIIIDELRELKSSTHDPNGNDPDLVLRDAKANCLRPRAGDLKRGFRFVGYEDVQTLRTARFDRGDLKQWFALDVGCALVRQIIGPETHPSGIQELAKMTPGEPDPGLFAVPQIFREVTISELYRMKPGPERDEWNKYYDRFRMDR